MKWNQLLGMLWVQLGRWFFPKACPPEWANVPCDITLRMQGSGTRTLCLVGILYKRVHPAIYYARSKGWGVVQTRNYHLIFTCPLARGERDFEKVFNILFDD